MKGCEEFCQGWRRKVVWPVVQVLLVMVGITLPVGAAAAVFQVAMDASRWVVDSSVYECRIRHEIPYYGEAVVAQAAGEKPRFQLLAQSAAARSGTASLLSVPPLWRPEGASQALARVDIKTGVQALAVEGAVLKRLLAELLAGQEVAFSGALTQSAEDTATVVLSPVNFRRAYQQYQQCLATLLPVNFEQIRRTALYFPVGSDELPKRDLTKLDNIALYAEADGSVQSFYVDGHTDSAGDRRANLELSQRRAEMVVSLLLERGIPLDRITTRWHGERYPVVSNRSEEGQAKNRRVTVRLERHGAGQVPAAAPAGAPATIKERRPQQEARSSERPDTLQEQARAGDGQADSAPWWLQ